MSDWADEAVLEILRRDEFKNESPMDESEQRAIAAALRKAKAEGMREAADMLLPADNSGLEPYSAMRFLYDHFRNAAQTIEDGKL